MIRHPTTVLAILLASALASCGDETTEPTVAAEAMPISVCGEEGVGFLARSSSHGLIPFGARVMSELGSFVAIDPACGFAMPLGDGVMLGGTLTDAQAEELSRFLALEEWETLKPEYSGWCASHLGPTSFRWGERSLELQPCSRLEPPPVDFRHDLLELRGALLERLEPWGQPLDGPVRYVLVDNSEAHDREGSDRSFRDAPVWPLGDPDAVAVMETYDGPPPEVHVASGGEAMLLRAIRDAWVAEEIGWPYTSFVPVVGPDGRRYELYARDVASDFEVEGGLVVPWLTTGELHLTAVVTTEASAIDFAVYCEDTAEPVAVGSLEDQGGSDAGYWRGEVNDVPAGACRVELNATAADGTRLDCVAYADGTDTPTIRSGSVNNASFRCGGVASTGGLVMGVGPLADRRSGTHDRPQALRKRVAWAHPRSSLGLGAPPECLGDLSGG